jgi:hypothetical protein
LATAFLIQAIENRYNGRFILFPELVEMLYQSVADHSEAKIIKTFTSYDCLLIDELGYVEVEPVQVGLFFTLMHKRHKTKTTLSRSVKRLPTSPAKGVCKPLVFSMSRINGGAVWSNCPCTDLARAPAEKLAGATLLLMTNGKRL